jgi:hypothetical protein
MERLRKRLTYANVMATIAVFIALGGASYAAIKLPKNSVGVKQLKKNAVTSAKIKNGQVKSDDVANQGLTGADIKDGTVDSFEIGNGVVTGAKIAAGAVGSASIADNAITGPKIADGTIGSADLDPNTVGDIISKGGTFPQGPQQEILVLPGFGKLTAGCTGADTYSLFYALEKGAQQNARLWAHDQLDNEPKGAAGVSGSLGGGVGYSASGHIALEGELFVFTPDRVLMVDFTLTGSCTYRLRATLDHNEA